MSREQQASFTSMPHAKYSAFEPVALPDRQWPRRVLTEAPTWCSVDLRDGNQALVEPMGSDRKHQLFETLVALGFREIEVGFPSASQTDFDFVRELIEKDLIPAHVTIQVLTQAREDLIRRTFEALQGAKRAMVHLYNSTSPLQRRVVFGQDRAGIRDIAVSGARLVAECAAELQGCDLRMVYSPESFSATELDFSLEICEAVCEVWGASPEKPVVLNLPATVEVASPNVYADQIEWFCRNLGCRRSVIVSVHPHNDRGCAVAAAELSMLAGAERVEGTLFGNGERTGNVDIVTLALNLYTQGVDPQLDLSDLDALVRVAEHCNRLPVHPRHPYAGELVYSAFSGSHQDAIKKGFAARARADEARWAVPYLPIDPADVGRSYDAVIRVNSQSGKGGVSYLLERDFGFVLPRWLQAEFSVLVQELSDSSGQEIRSDAIGALFEECYLAEEGEWALLGHRTAPTGEVIRGVTEVGIEAQLLDGEHKVTLQGRGFGPIDAFVDALHRHGEVDVSVRDYSEHTLGRGSDANAVAYVQLEDRDGSVWHGVGVSASIVTASLSAIISAINRKRAEIARRDVAARCRGGD